MSVVLATPLYPPDTTPAASYAKDLAGRLRGAHAVTVLAYTYLPEQVAGVRIRCVQKRAPLPMRLASFFFALLTEAKRHDRILAINGASIELPLVLVSLLTATPYVLIMRDAAASARAKRSFFLRMLERIAQERAAHVVTSYPPPRPEVLPLSPPPHALQEAYEEAWKAHLPLLSEPA